MTQDDRSSSSTSPVDGEDLSAVLSCLTSWYSGTRKTQTARDKLANHPLTREYLDAGLRLITEQFRPEERRTDDRQDGLAKQSAFFDWLSAQKVIDEVERGGRMRGNHGTFEDRWPYKDYYIQDLLSYCLWARHWAREAEIAEEFARPLAAGEDFPQAVHDAAYWSYRAQLANASTRVWLIAAAVSDRYPTIKQALAEVHDEAISTWLPVYQAVVTGRRLRLRPGVTLEDLIEIISALVTGITLRAGTEPAPSLVDHERRRSLLGTAAIAVLASCIDPGDGRTIEEAIAELIQPAPASAQ
jgi:hypothetical protein